MIWEPLPTPEAPKHWLERTTAKPPPLAYEVVPPRDIRERILPTIERLHGSGGVVTLLPSGLASVHVNIEQGFQHVEEEISSLALDLDAGREWSEWRELDADEAPSAHIHHDLTTRIDETQVLGPGGGLLKQLIGDTAVFDLSVHPRRGQGIGAPWRNLEQLHRPLLEALVGRDHARVRGCFGYYEASAFEVAVVVRPVFVFAVDQPARDHLPRWRITVVVPATSSDELPPELGLEGVVGACF